MNKFISQIINFPVYTFLTSIIFVLFTFNKFAIYLPISELIIPLSFNLSLSFISFIVYFYFKDIYKTGFFSIIFILFFYTYGYVYIFFNGSLDPIVAVLRHPFLIIIYFLVFSLLALFIKKISFNLKKIQIFLNLVSFVAFFFVLVLIYVNSRKEKIIIQNSFPPANPLESKCDTSLQKPDIFYLIYDTYGGLYSLKKYLDYDNISFYKFLIKKKFIIPKYSQCLYPNTIHSFSSLFSLGFFDLKKVDELLENNLLFSTFQKIGYQNHFITTGRDFNYSIGNLDYFHDYSFFKDFTSKLCEMSMMLALESRIMTLDHRYKIKTLHEEIEEMEQEIKPKLVFAHILCPHTPFVFGPDGEFVFPSKYKIKWGKDKFKKLPYTNQITYMNKLIEQTVTRILQNYKGNVVIVIQGDHGFSVPGFTNLKNEEIFNENDRKTAAGEILNAIYLPDGNLENLTDTISNVNTLRLILNKYFCTKLELIPNEIDYSVIGLD